MKSFPNVKGQVTLFGAKAKIKGDKEEDREEIEGEKKEKKKGRETGKEK